MIRKDSVVLLRETLGTEQAFIEAGLSLDISVLCVNQKTRFAKKMPFKAMYEHNNQFWKHHKAWEYYLLNEDFRAIQAKASALLDQWKLPNIEHVAENNQKDNDQIIPEISFSTKDGLGEDYVNFMQMSDMEHVEHLQKSKDRLDSLIAQKPRQEFMVTEALVETARDALLNNRAAIMNAMNLNDEEAKKKTQQLVDSTRDFVKASSQLISKSIFNDELMNMLVERSNGTIIKHMTHVYLNGMAFLAYYNDLVSGTSIINKLRVAFDKKYFAFYRSLMPHIHPDDISLERVFMGGMRSVKESELQNWTIGFLVHDIGKAANIEYHEGEKAYNREIVVKHVITGYSAVMNKTNYPKEAGLITGYHHEYYGDTSGYGYFRTLFEQYQKTNPNAKMDYCITYDLKPMMDFKALAYFPAKALEIIDIFDSLTDTNRKYREPLSMEQALITMRKDFIEDRCKIDIILFDIFKRFVEESIKQKTN